jgi:hypothetical protein
MPPVDRAAPIPGADGRGTIFGGAGDLWARR